MRNNRFKKKISLTLCSVLFLLSLISPSIVKADINDDSVVCVSTEKFDRVTNKNDLLKLAVKQSIEREQNTNSINMYDDVDTLPSENSGSGIMAIQLVETKTYSDGSIVKEYVADNLALENTATGETVTYVSSSLSKNISQYSIFAAQTVYFKIAYYESGVSGVYDDILIHATKEQSYVTYSTTAVAYITHGIRAESFLQRPNFEDSVTNGVPVSNKVYTVTSSNSYYYESDSIGSYIAFLGGKTANNNEFFLYIDLLQVLDG